MSLFDELGWKGKLRTRVVCLPNGEEIVIYETGGTRVERTPSGEEIVIFETEGTPRLRDWHPDAIPLLEQELPTEGETYPISPWPELPEQKQCSIALFSIALFEPLSEDPWSKPRSKKFPNPYGDEIYPIEKQPPFSDDWLSGTKQPRQHDISEQKLSQPTMLNPIPEPENPYAGVQEILIRELSNGSLFRSSVFGLQGSQLERGIAAAVRIVQDQPYVDREAAAVARAVRAREDPPLLVILP